MSLGLRGILTLICLTLLFSTQLISVSATHFAYGTISWVWKAGKTYSFNFESAWRTNYAWSEGTPTTTAGASGNQIYIGVVNFCAANVGVNNCNSNTQSYQWQATVTVTSIQPGNWFIGTTSTAITFPSQQTQWSYTFQLCCRLSTLQQNNNDANVRLSGLLTVGNPNAPYTASPTVTTFPRTSFVVNTPSSYSIPGFSPQGNPLAYSVTTSYTGLSTNPPTWTTAPTSTGAVGGTPPSSLLNELFAVQYTITDTVTGSYVILDEIFQIVQSCTSVTQGCSVPPIFNPPFPQTWTFYVGQQSSFTVTTTDATPSQTLTVSSTPLPAGATFTLTSQTPASTPSAASYVLTWSPTLGQNGRSVCFIAFNSQNPQQQSIGSNCANMVIGVSNILIVSCIIRDFTPTATDFNKASAGDDGGMFISSTLSGSGPPTFSATAQATSTIASPASFANWWTNDINTAGYAGQTAWDMVLTSPTLAGPYTYSQSAFYPIDNQLGGNNGGAHNQFFTLEGHTYISIVDPRPSTAHPNVLSYQSADDLYVFLNGILINTNNNGATYGWTLGGIPTSSYPTEQSRQVTIDLDAVIQGSQPNPYGLVYDDAAHDFPQRVDFFYAHRSSAHNAQISFQLLPSFLCNALSKGIVIADYSKGFAASAVNTQFSLLGTAAFGAGNAYLSLLNGNPQSNTGVAWFGATPSGGTAAVAVAQKILYGFEADFTFQFTGQSEGFALVLQSASPNAQGTAFGGLGYNGIANSLAIEFDAQQSADFNDQPAYTISGSSYVSHVAIHTGYLAANSASELAPYQLGVFNGALSAVATSPLTGLFMNFANTTAMNVKIVFLPPTPSSNSTAGWVKVYMGASGSSFNLAPVAEGQVNTALLSKMWGGSAYIGFTAATSDTNTADIQINNFKLTVVQASASNSVPLFLPSSIVAGTTGTFIIQLKDACNNRLTSGGDLGAISYTLTYSTAQSATTPSNAVAILDNGDGTYTINYKPTVAAVYTLTVYYTAAATNGGTSSAAPISSAPWSFTVYPAAAYAPNSIFAVTDSNGNALTNNQIGIAALTPTTPSYIKITGYDQFGNLASHTIDTFIVLFAPTINLTSPAPPDNAAGLGHYVTQWSTGAAGTYTLYVTLGGQNIKASPYTVTVLAGLAYAPQCSASGTGLTQTVAGGTGTFVITLRDVAGNLIIAPIPAGSASPDNVCNQATSSCSLTFQGTQPPAPAQAAGAPAISCSWQANLFTCTYQAFIAGPYTFKVIVNGLAMTSFPTVSIIPGPTVGANSLIPSTIAIIAGVPVSGVFIQAKDQYYNLETTPSSGTFTATYTVSAAAAAPATVSYLSNGQYAIVFTTTVAGPLTIAPQYNAAPISGTYATTVLPAAANTPSNIVAGATLIVTAAAYTSLTATPSGTFTLNSLDQYSNPRSIGSTAGSDVASFIMTLQQTTGTGATATTSVLPTFSVATGCAAGSTCALYNVAAVSASSNQYTFSYGYTVAGTYSLVVNVKSSGLAVTNSPLSIQVIPGPTSTPNCIAYGPGLQSAVSTVATSFTIVARDQFNNVENYGAAATADTFCATVGQGSTTCIPSTSAGSGLYTITYTSTLASGTFPVSVYHGTTVTPANLVTTVTVTAVPNRANLFIEFSGANFASAVVGSAASFTITEFGDNTFATQLTGGISLSVDIYHSSGLHLNGISVPSQAATSSTFPVTFTPTLTLPVGGTWSMAVTRGSAVAIARFPPATTNVNSPFTYAISAGAVRSGVVTNPNPLPLAQLANYSMTLALFDAFNNPAGSGGAGSVVYAIFTVAVFPTQTFTVTGVFNSASSVYSFSYQVTAATSYTVAFYYSNPTTGIAATNVANTNFVGQPGLPSALTSTVVGDGVTPSTLLTLNAHNIGVYSNSTFRVTVRDLFGNLIDSTAAGNSVSSMTTITSALSSPLNFINQCHYLGQSVYACSIQSDKASPPGSPFTLAITVNYNGASVGQIPGTYAVIIYPGAISASLSTVSVSSPAPAGSSVTAVVIAVDSYNNSWVGTLGCLLRDSNGIATAGTVTSNIGTYTCTIGATLPVLATTLAGSHPFAFTANSIGIVFSPAPASSLANGFIPGDTVLVVPGAVYAPATIVPASIPTTLVGTTRSFSITLRDQFNNVIVNPPASTVLAIDYFQGHVSCITADALNDAVNANQLRLVHVNQNCGPTPAASCPYISTTANGAFAPTGTAGAFQATFIPKYVGTFSLNVTVNGVPLPCASAVQLVVTTVAGLPDPTQSYVVGLPSGSIPAAQVTKLTAYLRDSFGNPILTGGYNLSIASTINPNTGVTGTPMIPQLNSPISDHGDGSYTFSIAPTLEASWYLPIVIAGAAPTDIQCLRPTATNLTIGNIPPGSTLPPSQCAFNVIAAQPWSWTIVGTPYGRAADPSNFVIQVTDAYLNPVFLSNLTLTVSSFNAFVTSYTFQGVLVDLGVNGGTAGQYQFNYFSLLGGATNFLISFVPAQSPQCLISNPGAPYLCPDGTCSQAAGTCALPPKVGTYSPVLLSAVCGFDYPNNPYRCADGSCQASAAACPGVKPCPVTGDLVSAVDGNCYAPSMALPCPAGYTACPITGVCAPSASQCAVPLPCPAGTAPCASTISGQVGVCRSDPTQCPSPRVCPANAFLCPDQLTCSLTRTGCQDPFTLGTANCTSSSAPYLCWTGQCASSFENCPTAKTCPAASPYVCPDGSCASSVAACLSPLPCFNNPFSLSSGTRCPDGTCKQSYSQCGSQTTCPTGWILCENNRCAPNLASCAVTAACPASTYRCADGSCRNNTYFCPSAKTCPANAPLLCGDGSCTTDLALCTTPGLCTTAVTCPDGSCTTSAALCPTTTTCPLVSPVLCPDGSCVSSRSTCAALTVAACPTSLPLRCPDGSCRGSLLDCPSRSACFSSKRPLRCSNGQCVESLSQCPDGNSLLCPSGQVRCPYGGCAITANLCPTPITCPLGSARCNDGSCRATCDITTLLPACPTNLPISCPIPTGGIVCVASSSQCPSFPVCPTSAPVRCIDATCASSVGVCPPVLNNVAGHVPCPDGSWGTNPFQCPTPSTCPVQFPFKCWDDTCRLLASDCPQAPTCPVGTYRCSTGACASTLWAASCVPVLSSCYGNAAGPVKCPASSTCTSAVANCFSATNPPSIALSCPFTSLMLSVAQASQLATSTAGTVLCRDGSCRYGQLLAAKINVGTTATIVPGICDDTTSACPPSLPYQCASGTCVADPTTQCPAPTQSFACPAGTLTCAGLGGACVPPVQCPSAASYKCPTPGQTMCASLNYCTSTTCPLGGDCALRCSDGTCGIPLLAAGAFSQVSITNYSAYPTINPCTTGLLQPNLISVGSSLAPGSACQYPNPVKCPGGFCAQSSLYCPPTQSSGSCPIATPFLCDIGVCVRDNTQCPIIPACDLTNSKIQRCGDGSCRPQGTCPLYNGCPLIPGSTAQRFRCPNGLCSTTTDSTGCLCVDTTSPGCVSAGCPPNYFKCATGQCLPNSGSLPSSCLGNSTVVVPSNGCPAGYPAKCPDGTCSSSAATCTRPNGCPAATPVRCTASGQNGACVASASQCTTQVVTATTTVQCANGQYVASASLCPTVLNGCPISTPVRCADGTCKQFPASAAGFGASASQVCSPVLTCAPPLVLCFDGSCQDSLAFCPAVPACPAGQVQCSDLSCVTSSAQCPTAKCPPSVPALCADGACVSSLTACPAASSPGSGIGGGTGNTQIVPNSVVYVAPTAAPGAPALPPGNPPGLGFVGTVPPADTQMPPTSAGVGSVIPSSTSRCASPLVECFDGACRTSIGDCISFAVGARSGASVANSTCESVGLTTCADGSCMPSPLLCPVIAACPPSRPVRCLDGSCVAGTDNSATFCFNPTPTQMCSWPGFTPSTTYRCEDGTCRPMCLPADGCPTNRPVQCANRECAVNAAACSAATVASPNGFVYDAFATTPRNANGNLPNTPVAATALSIVNKMVRRLLSASMVALAVSNSTVAPTAFPTTAPTAAAAGTTGAPATTTAPTTAPLPLVTPSYCYSNCRAQVKATAGSYSLPVGQASQIPVAIGGGAQLGLLLVPPAALQVANNATSTVLLTITPVGENAVRKAENRVFTARRNLFGGNGYLTFAESVLSPMVNITLAVPTQTYSAGITLKLAIDNTLQLPVTVTGAGSQYLDVCLAQLVTLNPYQYNTGGFAAWQCQNTPIIQTGDANYLLSGTVTTNGVYAMIYSPAYAPAPVAGISWALQNIGYLILILIAGIAFVFGVLYAITRLTRYRAKYHEERANVKKQQEEVDEMEQFGGNAGQKDDEVELHSNPMVVQMKDMQAKLDKTAAEVQKIEAEQRQQESAARREHIDALKNDRDQMMAELERLKKEVALQAKAQPAGPRHNSMAPPQQQNPYGSPASNTSARPQANYGETGQEGQAQRQEFQASRPKNKKGLD